MKRYIHTVFIILIFAISSVQADNVKEGKKLAFDRKKGNCLACHQIENGELAGNNGPPLIAMGARFPNRIDLFNQIWDATKNNKRKKNMRLGPIHNSCNCREKRNCKLYGSSRWNILSRNCR